MSADSATRNLRKSPVWGRLEEHVAAVKATHLRDLLSDTNRFTNFSVQADDLLLDYSRQRVDTRTMELLFALAEQQGLQHRVAAMFNGEIVNQSESRAALHTALRAQAGFGPELDGVDVPTLIEQERSRFLDFAEAIRSGARTGYGGKPVRRVINIGIGGSDLGPRMLARAMASPGSTPRVEYVAGMDGIELDGLLRNADPAETLFIVCSKTFTTLETRSNAHAAREWLLQSLPEEAVATNFAAVSVNDSAMDEFGIANDARFRIWEWVGGRYSVWSAIGLSAAIAIGAEAFRELLAGAAAMDEHFRTAALQQNLPVISALLGIWNINFLGLNQNVILPYDQRLRLFPGYLQQLVMESEGKSVDENGSPVDYSTGVSLWGELGSSAQHSFAQWLHQGASSAFVDYIGAVNGPEGQAAGAHEQAIANMIAQSQTLAAGKTEAEIRDQMQAEGISAEQIDKQVSQKHHGGNRPSSILLLRTLTPRTLGGLMAMYEHQVYVQSVIWGINPFDQWGVELGKSQAREYAGYLTNADTEHLPGIGQQVLAWKAEQ